MPRSLVWATHIDVLGVDHVVERRDDHLVIRSPSSPNFYWGNLLLFDAPPGPGDRERWESSFADAFADEPRVRHVTLAWDGPDAPLGSAQEEFVPRGYDLDSSIGLVATPADLRQHPRANQEVTVRALDPDADEDLWAQVIEVQVAWPHRPTLRKRRTANSLSISKRRSCSTFEPVAARGTSRSTETRSWAAVV